MKKVAIVTGANRGLGFATCEDLAKKGYEVILTARDAEKGANSASTLQKRDLSVKFMQLDTSNESSIQKFAAEFTKQYDHLDVLINNAGIFIDNEEGGDADIFKTKSATITKTFTNNTVGPFLLIQRLLPLMKKNKSGRIVNISSGMGQLAEMERGYAAYRISKTALNAVTQMFAQETKGSDILVNSVCPGWVKTDMGGSGATRTLKEGIAGIIWAATLPKGGPTGGFFRDGERLPW